MKGFWFDPEEKQNKTISRRPPRLDCDHCGLHRKCRSPKMEPTGEGKKNILVIAEAPGATEDQMNIQLVGKAGQTFRHSLEKIGIDLDRDCRKTNAISCRPTDKEGNNRPPTPKEIDCCRSRVWKEIETFKPKVIILLGNESAQCIYGHRWKKEFPGIMTLRGWTIPDRELNCWVCPTFHPSYVMRSEKQPTVLQTFEKDLKNILETLEKPFPEFEDERKLIEIHKDPKVINSILKSILILPPELLYMDYETSGLKPHAKGHFIKTVSLCWNVPVLDQEQCIAFPYSEEIKPMLIRILRSKNIRKAAHNFAFEENWSRVFLNCSIENMHLDTALAAHILDNRSKIAGLKYQVFVNFGVVDYASHLDEYILTPNNKSGNAFNRINEAPLDELLIYNGLDSLYGKRLAYKQLEELPNQPKGYGYDLFHEGMKTSVDIEDEGVSLDEDYCKKQYAHATRRIKHMEEKILDFPEVKRWQEREDSNFKLSSSDQLKRVLFDDLQLEVKKLTPKKNAKVDKNVLESYSTQVPFVKKLVEIKEMKTARDTYLKGWLREVVDGKIHPMYSLIPVTSYRSSCSRPNLQNVPIRDEDKKRMLRKAILPVLGNQILSADFRQVEVRVAACYTKDPMLIEYCKDSSKDMHRDMAVELFMLPKELIHKSVRHLAKNGFVFPEFYGDYYVQVATAMWEEMDKRNLMLADNSLSLKTHLFECGMRCYEDFEDHVKEIETNFWKVRFREYDQWKWNTYNDYLRKGYVDSLTGFRYTGPLERKHICNYPIQGSAFHCLLWSLIRLNEIRKEEKLKSKIVLQIHDEQVWNLYPPEKKVVTEMIDHVCTKELPEHFKWIIVPMGVDMELSEINQSWYYKKPLEV